jgi:hypothetical protein
MPRPLRVLDEIARSVQPSKDEHSPTREGNATIKVHYITVPDMPRNPHGYLVGRISS